MELIVDPFKSAFAFQWYSNRANLLKEIIFMLNWLCLQYVKSLIHFYIIEFDTLWNLPTNQNQNK